MAKKVYSFGVPRNTALCYVRQSITRDENDTDSPERQRSNIEEYCAERGWIAEWYEDAEGHKSGSLENNRPRWLALKKRLADPDVVAVVANDFSRLHRKTYRMGELMDFCREHHIEMVKAVSRESLNIQDSTVSSWVLLESIFNEMYVSDISRRIKDSVRHRRKQGKTSGRPPFGTVRNEEGYLTPSKQGAWYLPDGSHVAGIAGEPPPHEAALWRGYFECTERILTLYATGQYGYPNLAFQLSVEGWAFRTGKKQPRLINSDDVRRVTSNWREYAGLALEGRAKDQNASLLDHPEQVLDTANPARAVFPLDLLRAVAQAQSSRSVTTRPPGIKNVDYYYLMTGILYCAKCESEAERLKDAKYRSRIVGHSANKKKYRYRHADHQCTGHNRSIPVDLVDGDIQKLIQLLTVDPEMLPLMTELALQNKYGVELENESELEKQKQRAIAKCKRRIENNLHLFRDGTISREEYLSAKQKAEEEIQAWEARTTDRQKIAIELQTCIAFLDHAMHLWAEASDQDRQGLVRMLFEYVIYDLDQKQITRFKLKPWADRFLVLRASLYEQENKDDTDNSAIKDRTRFCPYRAIKPLPAPRLPMPFRDFCDFCIRDNRRLINQSPVRHPNRNSGICKFGANIRKVCRIQNSLQSTKLRRSGLPRLFTDDVNSHYRNS